MADFFDEDSSNTTIHRGSRVSTEGRSIKTVSKTVSVMEYPSHPSFDILLAMLNRADPMYSATGDGIRNLFDPQCVEIVSHTGFGDNTDIHITIKMNTDRIKILRENLEDAGFLRKVETCPTKYTITISISDVEFILTIPTKIVQTEAALTLFTCDNLCISNSTLKTKLPDPKQCHRGVTWLIKCMNDIQHHTLVPIIDICLDSNSTPPKRIHTIESIKKTLVMIADGWTLSPDGKRISFEVSNDESKECSICITRISSSISRDISNTPLKLKCGHVYHLKCIETMIHSGGPSSAKCPTCRAYIIF
jgi:hypothetical protein